jgi:phage terminase small subunit
MVDDAHDDKLTDKQEAFVTAYLSGDTRLNATRAAIAAGYAQSGARQEGHRLMANPKVRARIDEYLKAMALTPDEVLAELKVIALAPMEMFQQVLRAEYTDAEGRKHPAVIRQDLSSKVKAPELLGKAVGLFAQQVDVNLREMKTIIGVRLEDV